MKKEMLYNHNTEIFKEVSIGLSQIYNTDTACVAYIECSPADGVELKITTEHAKGNPDHKVLFKKWLTKTDVICLRKMLQEAETFYDMFKKEDDA
jgi:hypothetical protein